MEDQNDLVARLFRHLSVTLLRSKGVNYLHYMAPLSTIHLISMGGILSFNQRQRLEQDDQLRQMLRSMGSESIADPSVQDTRHNRMIFGKSLHDYVPLYFGIHTPMQYVITKQHFDTQSSKIVFADVDLEQVFYLEGVLYTDGNAASSETRFYEAAANILGIESINWHIVMNESRCFSREYKRIKCAEVLVPDRIPPEYIRRYVVMNQTTHAMLQDTLTKMIEFGLIEHTNFEVCCDPTYFYSLEGEKVVPNA